MENQYKYKPVIGLEIHVHLNTKTKLFCDSLNDSNEAHPNINICPVCLAHPGTLPVLNIEAVKKVIMAGLALGCKIEKDTFFERKNYFYPDLPKGYQISQYQKPLCYNGWLDIGNPPSHKASEGSKRIRITRIHLEEDAGRLYHPAGAGYSLVDYNRAGVPLMELVTEPDFESGEEVRKFAEELQLILRYLGVSDADMEKGQMRVEVNISLRPQNDTDLTQNNAENQRGLELLKMGTKVEVKNINSIKFAVDAVDYEIKRQTELIEAGEKIKQETRGWDESKKSTFSQRSKEEAHDYRYFPEPDLPSLHFEESEIEKIRARLPELPQQRRERFSSQYSLPERDIELFTANKLLGNYFEQVASELSSFDKLDHLPAQAGLKKPELEHSNKLFKLASNYIITELKRMAEEVYAEPSDTKVSPEMLADLVVRIFHGEVSSSGAQTVLKEMFATGAAPGKIIEEKDLVQLSSVGDLEMAVDKVVADNPKAVEDFKNGKEESLKFIIGMVMRETKGKANPQVVEEILKNKLK